jgi:hypothetical protein
MTSLMSLWLPILVASVLVFIASSILNAVLPWHSGDYKALPDEARFNDAVRPLAIPPGDYVTPRAGSMAAMKSPEYARKRSEGPNMFLTVMPNGVTGMGGMFVQWFLYLIVVSLFGGYVASRALPPGAEYLSVFRFVGTTTFAAYALGLWPLVIWYRRSTGTTIRQTIDGLIYALLTAGVFGWLWPR